MILRVLKSLQPRVVPGGQMTPDVMLIRPALGHIGAHCFTDRGADFQGEYQ
jgi:hypothetical protein